MWVVFLFVPRACRAWCAVCCGPNSVEFRRLVNVSLMAGSALSRPVALCAGAALVALVSSVSPALSQETHQGAQASPQSPVAASLPAASVPAVPTQPPAEGTVAAGPTTPPAPAAAAAPVAAPMAAPVTSSVASPATSSGTASGTSPVASPASAMPDAGAASAPAVSPPTPVSSPAPATPAVTPAPATSEAAASSIPAAPTPVTSAPASPVPATITAAKPEDDTYAVPTPQDLGGAGMAVPPRATTPPAMAADGTKAASPGAHVDATPAGILAPAPQAGQKQEPAGSHMVPPANALLTEAAAPVTITQDLRPPSVVLDGLFEDIARAHIYADAKTAVDAIPDESPEDLLAQYKAAKARPDFVLKDFVSQHFTLPERKTVTYQRSPNENVRDYIMGMWDVLQRPPDTQVQYSSQLPLPYTYVVPGGRFSELYYWDSYFTMIGLYEDGKIDLMRDMVRDMASMIDRYGHIPNGSRTYYLSRSQVPFFSLMVDLLAMHDGQVAYTKFLPELQAEYDYWMDGADSVSPGGAYRHVVRLPDGTVMNRHWDDRDTPRDESYPEDLVTAASQSARKPEEVYRDLRAGSETGWDFTSRWLADGHTLSTIHTTDLLTVELNCLIPHLAQTLSHAYALKGDKEAAARYARIADERVAAMQRILWDERRAAYIDYDWKKGESTSILSGATAMPLFLQMATPEQAKAVAETIRKNLLKVGGLVATERTNSGQQWDAPNGWAPLQWMAVKGLNQYGYDELASDIAARWMGRVIGTYEKSGVLLEKYDVSNPYISPKGGKGGGEYPMQIGFGWTNGTLLGLMDRYPQNTRVVLDHNPAADLPDRPTVRALPPMNAYGVQSDKDTIDRYNLPLVTVMPRPVAPTPSLPQVSSVGESAPTPPSSAPPVQPTPSATVAATPKPAMPATIATSGPAASAPPQSPAEASTVTPHGAATAGEGTTPAVAHDGAPQQVEAPAAPDAAPSTPTSPSVTASAPASQSTTPQPTTSQSTVPQPPAGASAVPPVTAQPRAQHDDPMPTLPPHVTDAPKESTATPQPAAH